MTRRPWLFVAGVLVVLVAVVSPLEREASLSFAVHMIQHMLMVLVAAPLISMSRVVGSGPRFLRSIVVVWALHAVALWAWHMPALYDAGMRSDPLHGLEHLSFLVTAVLFWSCVIDSAEHRFTRVGLVFATMLQSGALGVVLAFASSPLYEWHLRYAGPGEVLADQQLAGAIMWIPPGIVYLAVMLGLLARALSALDAAEQS